jgi:hypothetical protein
MNQWIKNLSLCSALFLTTACFGAETLSAIQNPELEEDYQEAPLAQASSKLSRDHWYDDLSIEGQARHNAAKKRRVIVVEDEDQPEYVLADAPKSKSRTASKIDQALTRKIAMLRQQLNQKILNVVENMNVEVK